MSNGAFVISFDFEMGWSLRRSPNIGPEFSQLDAMRDIVPRMLQILDRYRISATWATVGHLMLRPQDCPGGRFSYDLPSPRFSWFQGEWFAGIPRIGEQGWQWFYAPDLVEQIIESNTYQELGSHTFSHIDVGDPACSKELARAEFELCQTIARNWGRRLRSVVFPHNFAGHLETLEEAGYDCYRTEAKDWYWLGLSQNGILRSRFARLFLQPLRYMDERLPVTPALPAAKRCGNLWEIPQSMFFPGFAGISKYISAASRVRRATLGLHRAAKLGRLFSFYTHPENFIHGGDQLLDAFDEICREAAELREAGKLDILTMEEAASRMQAVVENTHRVAQTGNLLLRVAS
ncbi:MAG TPA: polysaccharide deacetylase family protein [Pirellulales bacterium]|jgi:peptidoglycan/xylan/chitin deacetylase (PgdA/CDA1 family)|nr:polysaccharide deacetylase family protein [Pirellulales bacterium]